VPIPGSTAMAYLGYDSSMFTEGYCYLGQMMARGREPRRPSFPGCIVS